MTYQETIQYLFTQTPVFEKSGASAYKEGLSNTLALDEHFDHPHSKFKTIHIAGTNGKGSCSHTIAAILQAKGYRVGLYTSPHLVDFKERIRINGACIEEDYVVEFVRRERDFFEPLQPSFFEIVTAMAFKYFAEKGVDIAVVEVRLGGRLDCTNIINPILSDITNISCDHTQFLGNTLEAIACEKAGIIKANVPVVIGEALPETRPVFADKARKMNAPIHFAEEMDTCLEKGEPTADDYEFELQGFCQGKNKQTILCAAKVLGIAPIYIKQGMANVCEMTGLEGRWQVLRHRPVVVCDTGHNAAGWEHLSRQIMAQNCEHLRIVFGMVDDKDIDTVLDMLPRCASYYWTKANTQRAISPNDIKAKAEIRNLEGQVYPDVQSAYRHALEEAGENDFIFVGGSSYVVADLLTNCKRSAFSV